MESEPRWPLSPATNAGHRVPDVGPNGQALRRPQGVSDGHHLPRPVGGAYPRPPPRPGTPGPRLAGCRRVRAPEDAEPVLAWVGRSRHRAVADAQADGESRLTEVEQTNWRGAANFG